MPRLQLGLYMMSRNEAKQAVRWALAAGYRGFDCAQMYHNEREAGQGIREFLASSDNLDGLTRGDIHYTTKLSSNSTSYNAVRRSIKQSVDACGLGYVDLFLLHSPYGGKEARLTSWKALEDAVKDGEVRMAGVSNYGVHHVCVIRRRVYGGIFRTNSKVRQIEELMASQPRIRPVVNQIEVHPFNTQRDIRATCEKHNIIIEAYAPLVRGMRMRHPVILSLSKKYACTEAQLLVR